MLCYLSTSMTIYSLAAHDEGLTPIEVEIISIPGPPTFHVLGAKEGAIKDLLPRIRSAAIAQNFEWPRAKQIIVNLRPAPVQVNSRGLDLAILVGVLAATGQIELPEGRTDWIFYGELTLDGEILAPQDLFLFRDTDQLSRLITGKNAERGRVIERIGSWQETGLPTAKGTVLPAYLRPELTSLTVTSKCAEFMALVAAGEHATLMAGPAGSGKTTVAELIYQMLADPTQEEWQEMRSWGQLFNRDLQWRPKVMPHHSTPVLSMLGGGFPPYPGELTRAHGGLLILDEYLEFSPRVQEGLREPLEKGEITISRRNQSKAYPARFLLIATTNLCPCGDLTPDRQSMKRCQLSLIKCRSHLERLSGPMLDRFDVLTFSSRWCGTRDTPLELIYERVERAQAFRKSLGQSVPNGRMPLDALEDTLAPWLKALGDQRDGASRRRWRAELRVARTLADLEQSDNIQAQHLKKAQEYTLRPFMELRQIFA